MKVKRTEQVRIKPDKGISHLCHLSKNLYNEANYIVRQTFFETGKWVRYGELNRRLHGESENYRSLPAQTAQQILKLLDKSWLSFFRAIKEWKKHPEKFKARPRIPGYKRKDGEHILILTSQQCRIKGGEVKFPKLLGMTVKTRLDGVSLREVRVVPQGVGYMVEIVYEKEVADRAEREPERIAGIDLGVRNLVTIANNIGEKPIVVRGGIARSVNQFCNKELARVQSIYAKQGIKTGAKERKLYDKRNRKIKDHLHKVSRFVVDYCEERGIDTVVIGYNEDWKQKVGMGKRSNQGFVEIPFGTLVKQIRYKAEEAGIRVVLQEESHTSKCSFLDNEPVEHHEEYLGKRFRRGLFRSARGEVINADVQGALNIIKKAVPEAFAKVEADGIEGVVRHPARVKLC